VNKRHHKGKGHHKGRRHHGAHHRAAAKKAPKDTTSASTPPKS
jgi:hypothetical protein